MKSERGQAGLIKTGGTLDRLLSAVGLPTMTPSALIIRILPLFQDLEATVQDKLVAYVMEHWDSNLQNVEDLVSRLRSTHFVPTG